MNLEFLVMFAIFLGGFAVIYWVAGKLVEWLFGANDQETQ